VTINACGEFDGMAWGENIGWINFRPEGSVIKTSWVSPTDAVAPVTAPDAPVQTWYTSNVNFGLTATDCGHGVQEIRYTIDSGSEMIVPGSTATVNITIEGIHTISYYAVDNDSNSEGPNNETIRLDKTAPAITIITPADGATYYQNNTVIADYAVTDGLSGVNTVSAPVGSAKPIDTSILGVNLFTVDADDVAGNTDSVTNTYTVIADTTPPVITITTPADGATYLINEMVTVDFTVTDNETGIATQSSTLPNGSLIDTTSTGSYSFTVGATDNAGNSNSVTNNYTVAYPPANIDPDADGSQYAWGENVGWINFAPSTGPGVAVTDTAVYGFAWGENGVKI
jgi:hypothetical protein